MLLIGPNINVIKDLKVKITVIFNIKDLSPVSYFLALKITRDRPNRYIILA